MNSSRFNTLLLAAALFSLFLFSHRAFADDKKRAERDKALAEADRKAFEANMDTYETGVRPFLEKHCIPCHGPKKLKGDISLDLLDPDMKESTSAARLAVVLVPKEASQAVIVVPMFSPSTRAAAVASRRRRPVARRSTTTPPAQFWTPRACTLCFLSCAWFPGYPRQVRC